MTATASGRAGSVVEDGRMIGDRWGVTDAETARSYPCDDFVAAPTLQAWRGVTVRAPAEAVWPWVAQVLPEPKAGERFTTAAGRQRGRIVSVDPGEQLTATIMGAYLSYVLVPADQGATRLLLKVVSRAGKLAAVGLSVGDLVMARRQLLNLKRLAERRPPPA
jgi:hypothetical protein